MISPDVASRLWNWKFESAAASMHAEDDKLPRGASSAYTDDEASMINGLNRLFGNVGYFNGEMSDLVRGAVAWILQQPLNLEDERWIPPQLRGEASAPPRG